MLFLHAEDLLRHVVHQLHGLHAITLLVIMPLDLGLPIKLALEQTVLHIQKPCTSAASIQGVIPGLAGLVELEDSQGLGLAMTQTATLEQNMKAGVLFSVEAGQTLVVV
jgi:hypothetical protein